MLSISLNMKQFVPYLLIIYSCITTSINCQSTVNDDVPCQPLHYDIQLFYENIPVTVLFEELNGIVNVSCIAKHPINNLIVNMNVNSLQDVTLTKNGQLIENVHTHNKFENILNITLLNVLAHPNEEYHISFKYSITLSNYIDRYYQSIDILFREYYQRLDFTRFAHGTLIPYMTGSEWIKSTFKLSVTHPKSLQLVTGIPIHEITIPTKHNMVTTITKKSIKMNIHSFGYGFTNVTDNLGQSVLILSPNSFHHSNPLIFLKSSIQRLEGIIYSIMISNNQIETSTLGYRRNIIFVVPDLNENSESYYRMIYLNAKVYYYIFFNNIERQRFIALLSAYELAYQWFGHFIQPNHMRDLWLSKSIPVYLQMQSVNESYNDWEIWNEFTYMYTHPAFEYDVDRRAFYLEGYTEMITHDFQNDVFIKKGAAVIRMLASIAGEKQFNSALGDLFKRTYNQTEGYTFETFIDSILDVVSLTAQNTIKLLCDYHPSILNLFTSPGYPVVSVYKIQSKIGFSQQIFSYNNQPRSDGNVEDEHHKRIFVSNFYVPITYTTSSELDFNATEPKVIMDRIESIEPANLKLDPFEFIIVNIQQTGYYRVNYFESNWLAITEFLMEKDNIKKIHVLNRAQLIDDSFHLARAGLLKYKIPFDLIAYLANEEDLIPWSVTIKCLNFLENFFIGDSSYRGFQVFYSSLINSAYTRYKRFPFNEGLTNNVVFAKGHLMKNIFETACRLELPECVSFALDIHKKKTIDAYPQTITQIVLCTAIRNGNIDDWLTVRRYYVNIWLESLEAASILKGLACTRDPSLIVNLLHTTIHESIGSEDRVKLIDVIKVLLEHDVGRLMIYHYLRRYPRIVSNLKPILFTRLFENVIQTVTHQFEYDDYTSVLDVYSSYVPNDKIEYLKGKLDEIKITHLSWRKQFLSDIKFIIKNNSSTETNRTFTFN